MKLHRITNQGQVETLNVLTTVKNMDKKPIKVHVTDKVFLNTAYCVFVSEVGKIWFETVKEAKEQALKQFDSTVKYYEKQRALIEKVKI